MPGFNDLITTLTARLGTEEDFAFTKIKEQLATVIRAEHLSKIRDSWKAKSADVSIDDDGDIAVLTDRGYLYVMKDALIATTGRTSVGSLRQEIEHISALLDDLFTLRSPIRPTSFSIRLLIKLKFSEHLIFPALQSRSLLQCLTPSVMQYANADALEKVGWRANYRDKDFTDGFEISAEAREITVRCNRDGKFGPFSSFGEFSSAADFSSVVDSLKPFMEPLIADSAKIRGPAFVP